MHLRLLQLAQFAWVTHNFPRQLTGVTGQEIMDFVLALPHEGDSPMEDFNAIAAAINDGRLRPFPHHGLLGTMEEMGELIHTFLKCEQRIRGQSFDNPESMAAMEDAVGDLIIFLCSFCNTNKIDLEKAVYRAWNEVKLRDWVAFPGTGRDDGSRGPGYELPMYAGINLEETTLPPCSEAVEMIIPQIQCLACHTFFDMELEKCPECQSPK